MCQCVSVYWAISALFASSINHSSGHTNTRISRNWDTYPARERYFRFHFVSTATKCAYINEKKKKKTVAFSFSGAFSQTMTIFFLHIYIYFCPPSFYLMLLYVFLLSYTRPIQLDCEQEAKRTKGNSLVSSAKSINLPYLEYFSQLSSGIVALPFYLFPSSIDTK